MECSMDSGSSWRRCSAVRASAGDPRARARAPSRRSRSHARDDCYRKSVGATPAGVYLTFFDEGAALSAELPALGPYDDIVIRGARVIGERAQLGEMIAAHAADGRWIGAESAAGRGAADATRSHIRLRADR